MERVPMLAEGYEKLTADLQALRQERPRIVDAIEEARAHGDLSENAEYHAAKERQGQVEAQIAQLWSMGVVVVAPTGNRSELPRWIPSSFSQHTSGEDAATVFTPGMAVAGLYPHGYGLGELGPR